MQFNADWTIVQSHIDGSGVLQCFGIFPTEDVAEQALKMLQQLLSDTYKLTITRLWT